MENEQRKELFGTSVHENNDASAIEGDVPDVRVQVPATSAATAVTSSEQDADDEDLKEGEETDDDNEVEEQSMPKKKTIADMGYHFKDGQLRSIEGDGPFKFTTQKAYEELGDLIGEYVYDLMEETGLKKIYFEVGTNRRFYFASLDYDKKERILVLIHGSGVVKAGQWARKLIINESLSRGTQLDYIKRGLALDWGIVVLNYNEKCEGKDDRCHGPDSHGMAEWTHAITPDIDAQIFVVAHSAGGCVVSEAVRRMRRVDDNRVLFVSLTDSWFSEGKDVFSVNWNTMKKKLHRTNGTWQMYSGDDTHEGTSAACINSVFALMEGVSEQTTGTQFLELLQASEQIVMEDFKEKLRKKIQERKDAEEEKAKEEEVKRERKDEEEKEDPIGKEDEESEKKKEMDKDEAEPETSEN